MLSVYSVLGNLITFRKRHGNFTFLYSVHLVLVSTQTKYLGFLKVIGSPFSMIVLVLFLVPLPVAPVVSAQQVDAQDLVDTLGSVAKVPVFP